ncbi:MAG: hypothetical protein K2J85_03370 [Anaeroplasmataceae bacterium]|nr:hypothetical protein [Anaeroplasmataceae bacterium]
MMKKYFKSTDCEDIKIIGNTFPQCHQFIKEIDRESKEDFYTADRTFLNGDINNLHQLRPLYGLKLDRRAKVTDHLVCIVPGVPVLNNRFIELLQQFKLGKYFTLPITIIEEKNKELHYFCFCCLNRFTDYVDFPSSIFRKHDAIVTHIKDFEDYKASDRPKPVEIRFNNKKVANFDVFKLQGITYGSDLFISEELADKLVKENITGIEIDRKTVAIVE